VRSRLPAPQDALTAGLALALLAALVCAFLLRTPRLPASAPPLGAGPQQPRAATAAPR
jgi:hypothetical protein